MKEPPLSKRLCSLPTWVTDLCKAYLEITGEGGSGGPQSMAFTEPGVNWISELSNSTPQQTLLEEGGQGWSVAYHSLLFLPTGCQPALLSSKALQEQKEV